MKHRVIKLTTRSQSTPNNTAHNLTKAPNLTKIHKLTLSKDQQHPQRHVRTGIVSGHRLSPPSIERVDPNLWATVFKYLDVNNTSRVSIVCKTWNKAQSDNTLWKLYFSQKFAEVTTAGTTNDSLNWKTFFVKTLKNKKLLKLNDWTQKYFQKAIKMHAIPDLQKVSIQIV